jgi:tetratricopeptide (TPR) repeat protein
LQGAIAEALGDVRGAAEAFGKAYDLEPSSYQTYMALARANLISRGDSSQNTLPPPPPGLSGAQNLALGLLFVSHDAYGDAVRPLESAVKQDESNDIATLNLVISYKNTGKRDEAIDLARRFVARQPSAAMFETLGGLQEEAGKYVDAVQSYQRAVDLDPSNEEYYFDLGLEYLSHFTFGPAREVYEIGTTKFPHVSRQFLGLAFSHYAVREYPQAADAFTKAIEIDPESPAAQQAWNTVLTFLSPKDWDALLPRLSRLQVAYPHSAALAFCYGAALFRYEHAKGPDANLGVAQKLLEKAIELQPQFPPAHLELGGIYASQKEMQKAVDQYLIAVQQDPKSDIAHYRLGQVYREMNKLELATQELGRYQELSRIHQEELKRSRSAIQQFILAPLANNN